MTRTIQSLVIKTSLFAAVLVGLSIFVVLVLTGQVGGPTDHEAFEEIFERVPPGSVKDIRYEYHSHSKGYGYYLSFVADADDLSSLFDVEQAIPMHVDDVVLTDLWSSMAKFEELHGGRLPELKDAKIIVASNRGHLRELVLEPTTHQMFCYYLADTDIK